VPPFEIAIWSTPVWSVAATSRLTTALFTVDAPLGVTVPTGGHTSLPGAVEWKRTVARRLVAESSQLVWKFAANESRLRRCRAGASAISTLPHASSRDPS
jgi:hypothetical protein